MIFQQVRYHRLFLTMLMAPASFLITMLLFPINGVVAVIFCGYPGTPINGFLHGSDFSKGKSVNYSCKTGYKLVGSQQRTCQSDGVWSGSLTTCIFVNTCISNPCQNGGTCIDGDNQYTCSCIHGYTGVHCEKDIQPPITEYCPIEIRRNSSSRLVNVTWRAPEFYDPFDHNVEVTSNYPHHGSVFLWGNYTARYTALKPFNGLRANCTFRIFVRNNATKTRERSDIACNAENIEIFLPKNLLPLAPRVTWSDPNCIITSNSTHYISIVKHGECGTTVSLTTNNVIFENEIKANPLTTTSHLLDFGTNPYVIPVKCIYPRKEMSLSSYQPVKQQVRVYEKRFGHLDIDMRQFETDQFSHALDNSTIPKLELNSDIFIKVRLQNFGSADLGIHLDTCIATKTPTPYDNMFIKLIENGCPKNNFVHLLPSPSRETRFSLRAFEFTSSRSNVVYIHCQASVCLANSSQCNPDCSSSDRTRRDVSSNPSHLLSMGPVVLVADSIPTSNLIANTIAGVSVAVAIVAMVIAAKEWRKKRTVDFSDNSLCRFKS